MYVESTGNLYNAYSDIDNGNKNAASGAEQLSSALSNEVQQVEVYQIKVEFYISKNKELASGIESAANTINR